MDTFQLINILKKDKFARKYFCGVLPIDKLPIKKINKTCAFIINTHNSSLPGEHWFAIFLPKIGNIEYFDSYGKLPFNKEVYEFIKVNKRKLIHNYKNIQSEDSQNCGKYCIFYLYMRSRGYKMKELLKFFSENKLNNEYFINNLFKNIKIIKKYM